MRIPFVLTVAVAFGTILLPTTTQAEPCGVGDEVFSVHVRGIVPDKIYHNDLAGVCFDNESDRALWLLYRNDEGNFAWSSKIDRGRRTEQLARLGDNQEVFAAILFCGYDGNGNLKQCRAGETPTHYRRHEDMLPATLYERPAPLHY